MKAGKTVDQAAAEYKVPAKFKGYVVTVNEQFASAKTNEGCLRRTEEVVCAKVHIIRDAVLFSVTSLTTPSPIAHSAPSERPM